MCAQTRACAPRWLASFALLLSMLSGADSQFQLTEYTGMRKPGASSGRHGDARRLVSLPVATICLFPDCTLLPPGPMPVHAGCCAQESCSWCTSILMWEQHPRRPLQPQMAARTGLFQMKRTCLGPRQQEHIVQANKMHESGPAVQHRAHSMVLNSWTRSLTCAAFLCLCLAYLYSEYQLLTGGPPYRLIWPSPSTPPDALKSGKGPTANTQHSHVSVVQARVHAQVCTHRRERPRGRFAASAHTVGWAVTTLMCAWWPIPHAGLIVKVTGYLNTTVNTITVYDLEVIQGVSVTSFIWLFLHVVAMLYCMQCAECQDLLAQLAKACDCMQFDNKEYVAPVRTCVCVCVMLHCMQSDNKEYVAPGEQLRITSITYVLNICGVNTVNINVSIHTPQADLYAQMHAHTYALGSAAHIHMHAQ